MQPLSLLVIYDKVFCWKVFQTPTVPPSLLRETYFMPSLSSLMNPEEIRVSHPAVRCEGSWGKKMAIRNHVDWVLLARRLKVALILLTLSLSAFDLLLLCIRKAKWQPQNPNSIKDWVAIIVPVLWMSDWLSNPEIYILHKFTQLTSDKICKGMFSRKGSPD